MTCILDSFVLFPAFRSLREKDKKKYYYKKKMLGQNDL